MRCDTRGGASVTAPRTCCVVDATADVADADADEDAAGDLLELVALTAKSATWE